MEAEIGRHEWDSFDSLQQQIDACLDPPDVLVIREKRSPRVIGLLISLLLGALFSAFAFGIAQDGDLSTTGALVLTGFITFFALCALRLFWQLVFGRYYYVALSEEALIRRNGPFRVFTCPSKSIRFFEKRRGGVYARLDDQRSVLLMKDAYAPQDLSTLVERLSAWKNAPPTQRNEIMERVNLNAILRQRRIAGHLFVTGFGTFLLDLFLIAKAVNDPEDNAWIGFSALGACFALGQLLTGAWLSLAVRWKHSFRKKDDPEESLSV